MEGGRSLTLHRRKNKSRDVKGKAQTIFLFRIVQEAESGVREAERENEALKTENAALKREKEAAVEEREAAVERVREIEREREAGFGSLQKAKSKCYEGERE